MSEPTWVCVTCGVQFPESGQPPPRCPICEDERQYVGWGGQRWETTTELGSGHANELREEETNLWGIGVTPAVGIGQRALLVCSPEGNVLWDCVPVLDETTVTRLHELGGIAAICCSHPHFYGALVDFAEEFDAPILLPSLDREWIMRPSERVVLWETETIEPVPGITVARIGGHFPGAAVLHWPAGAEGRGALLTGDTVTVVQDRRYVSFMWSYPNLIPLDEATVRLIADRVDRFPFDRVYGGWWGRVVLRDGAEAVRSSAN
ncbi:MAG: MBL fold metallo-hydrolase, partial [Acidimicrobiales bacterium]